MNYKKERNVGLNFTGALGLLFIGLKLGGCIDWSWWYVLMPLYLPIVLALIIVGIATIIAYAADKDSNGADVVKKIIQ